MVEPAIRNEEVADTRGWREKRQVATLYHAYLEIARTHNGATKRPYLEALDQLRHSSLGERPVLGVIAENGEEAAHIPHFAYSAACKATGNYREGACQHDPESWGVDRYFGIHIVLGDGPDKENAGWGAFGRYVIDHGTQLELCGLTIPCIDLVERERNP